MERMAPGNHIVLDGIVDQGLQRKRGERSVCERTVDLHVEKEFVGIADFEQVAVCLGETQLFGQRGGGILAVLQNISERIGELVDIDQGFPLLPLPHEHR